MTTHLTGEAEANANANALLVGRLERIPVTKRLLWIRVIIGSATFFDAYTVLVIAFAMPQLVKLWNLSPAEVGLILSAGYVGQLFGAIGFGWLAERIGRLPVLLITIVLFVSMDIACLFAWGGASMMLFRFLQGIGTGGEVPVASAYINEFIGAKKRGRFFLLYELIFPIGLLFAGITAYFLVPSFGWKALFIVGIIPALVMIPLRVLMPESPRWLASKGRIGKAEKIVAMLENEAVKEGKPLPEPVIRPVDPKATAEIGLAGTVQGHLPQAHPDDLGAVDRRLHHQQRHDHLAAHPVHPGVRRARCRPACSTAGPPPRSVSLASVACALLIDKVGRKRWYSAAFLLAVVPLVTLALLGATSAIQILVGATIAYAILQTIAFSLYLYSAELYPTRLRAIGTGFGCAWLRAGSSLGPVLVGFIVAGVGIQYVFVLFAVIAVIGGLTTKFFGIETKGKVLEELSP